MHSCACVLGGAVYTLMSLPNSTQNRLLLICHGMNTKPGIMGKQCNPQNNVDTQTLLSGLNKIPGLAGNEEYKLERAALTLSFTSLLVTEGLSRSFLFRWQSSASAELRGK